MEVDRQWGFEVGDGIIVDRAVDDLFVTRRDRDGLVGIGAEGRTS